MDSMIDLEFVLDTQHQLTKSYRSDMESHQTTRFTIPIPGLYKYSFFIMFFDISSLIFTSVGGQVLGVGEWYVFKFSSDTWLVSNEVLLILGRLQKMLFSDCFNLRYHHGSVAYKTCITIRFYVLIISCYCTIQTVPSFHTRHMHF